MGECRIRIAEVSGSNPLGSTFSSFKNFRLELRRNVFGKKMKQRIIYILILSTLLTSLAYAQTKQADLAGSWYPASSQSLSRMLSGFLEEASLKKIDGEIIGIISPHAGYIFSGPVAAYGYKSIKDISNSIKTVIIIGFNHRMYHHGIAVCDFDTYKTPLGEVLIDKELTNELITKDEKIYALKRAFYDENSTEMQIPFLQVTLNNFKLVIIHIGEQSLENCKILSNALYEVLSQRDDFILIASTDLSHYLSYDKANEIDAYTISQIKKFDPVNLYIESSMKDHSLMCGYAAVCATLMASKKLGADSIEILKYANSGDITLDKRRAVGYLSAAIVRHGQIKEKGEKMLNKEQKHKLIRLARQSIEHYLKTGQKLPVTETDAELLKNQGAFVTLHRHSQLRGCIGNLIGNQPLYLTIRDMAIEAAVDDPRFPPLNLSELKDVQIEISVLSSLDRVDNPDKIQLGIHGVLIKRGSRSGVFLPQVATETGWSKEEFLSYLCAQKAGLSPSAWKDKDTQIYIFTAEVFSEKEF